ncbi:sulfite exporter TauE/SafE family protein [Ruegeria sp. Ofav3-42]|uniref:sulfite exporter TauE/SafE family protein n=1 Tax=Ruegeria sp. Ofav3-42 TaxID=2917759 RepID=UPI001EF4F557|nr:sulfite exporter TauE/SafE family protein [Ruegeria sp. Ofav3-42]MCG7522079.1 sulfite exporter TauE/SafE family protein [Ruegeria sp. Ofav3-42]
MTLFSIITLHDLLFAMGVAFLAGWVKGIVGFAMPMVLVSGLSIFLPPELAIAGLILPTLVTNVFQALGQGVPAAVSSIKQFRIFLIVGLMFLLAGAQLVTLVPTSTFLLMIGIPVAFFALIQVLGVKLVLEKPSARIEVLMGAVAGFIGGMSGIWGPPTVAYLTALNTPKAVQMRVQGVIYGLGAIALVLAHLGSGILRADTAPFSAALIAPAVAGMWVGMQLQSRIDQALFRKVTLMVLLVAGLNLLRRGLMG